MAGLVFGSVFGLMFLGLPICFAILACGIIVFTTTGLQPLLMVAQRLNNGMDSFPLLAVPLFIFVGNLMDKGGISKRLIDWAESLVGWACGGMGIVTIICCAVFAALTGSGPATVAAIGCLTIPAMCDRGYDKRTATGLVCSAGALGPIIPPSIPMVIYGCIMGLSVPDMFIGGVGPGLLIAALLIVMNQIKAHRTPAIVAAPRIPFKFSTFLRRTWSALGALFLPFIILGGIYSGIFTPTEAAAVASVYALIVGGLFYRELRIKELPQLIVSTMRTSAMGVFITGAANLLSFVLSNTKLTAAISTALLNVIHSKATFIIVLMLFLFVVGCLLDTIAAIIIIAPLLVPVGIQLGCDPLHIGVLFVINLVIGFVTPPFGYNLFTAASITGLKLEEVVKGTLPYLAVEMVALAIIAAFEPIITWLPGVLGG